jgi:preprotein translocase subunit Sss1
MLKEAVQNKSLDRGLFVSVWHLYNKPTGEEYQSSLKAFKSIKVEDES